MSYIRDMTYFNTAVKKYVFGLFSLAVIAMVCYAPDAWAATSSASAQPAAAASTPPLVGFGAFAENINLAIPAFTTLVASIGYLVGITFAVVGIMKFKQHRENPQQVPLGMPITMILVAAGLVFLPTMIKSTGSTLTGKTGTEAGAAEMGSPSKDASTKIWNILKK